MQIITIQYFFWQHLVNAELITPKVEWINITDNDPNLTRTRIQKSKGISGAGISVTTNGNDISGYSTSIKPSSLHNSYFFGGTDSIDVKLDDGKSYTGYVRGANANGICED